MAEKPTNDQNRDAPVKPDPETLHTTDPQEEMKGPMSSFMNSVKEGVEDEGRKINPDPDDKNKTTEDKSR